MMCDLRTVKLYTVNVVFLMRKRVRFVTPIAKVSLSPFDVAASNIPVFNMYAECLFSYRSWFLLLGERSEASSVRPPQDRILRLISWVWIELN